MGKCSSLILHCMDYRLQTAVDDWIRENKLNDDIDRIAIGGPCKDIELAMKFIKICIEKHGVRKVFLTQHDDCAGYGGHEAFTSLEIEREKMIGDMYAVKTAINENYPQVKVTTLLLQQEGENWTLVKV